MEQKKKVFHTSSCFLNRSILFLLYGFTFFFVSFACGEQNNTWLSPEKYSKNPFYRNSYAIIVGIEQYARWWPSLSFAKKDVEILSKRMQIHGFRTLVLLNKKATKKNILDTLTKDLAPNLGYKDNVLFFFVGQTYTEKDKKGNKKGFLVCYDTVFEELNKTGISLKSLGKLVAALPCKHTYIMVDGCLSGTELTREKKYAPDTEGYLSRVASKQAVQVIVAGSNKETLVTIGGIGLLVRNFIDALNGGADSNFDGFLTAAEIGRFLKPTVNYISSGFQTPEYGRYSGSGENIFKVVGKIELSSKGEPKDIYSSSDYSLYDLPEVIFTPNDKSEMVLIPKGEFTFGSNSGYENEKPAYKVYLDDYYIDRHEVTNAQYHMFNPDHKRDPLSSCDECPVTNVSWYDAVAFGNWAGKRLPTEAEWEKAARGTTGRRYAYGNEFDPGMAWSKLEPSHKSSRVAKLMPNYEGLYDMTGNVWEWCSDWYDADYYKRRVYTNPRGNYRGKEKIIKGGSWVDKEFGSRASLRKGIHPEQAMFNIGFRLAKSPN